MEATHQMKIRLPGDIKAFLATQAGRNGSTLNSEVIRALRERMDREAETSRVEQRGSQ